MSQNIDEYSSDEVTVYKDEGEEEEEQVIGENFGVEKVELIKEAEQVCYFFQLSSLLLIFFLSLRFL